MIIPKIKLEYTAVSYIKQNVRNLSRPLAGMAAMMAVDARDRIIATGMDGGGRRFKPYAPGTKKQREKLGLQTQFKDFKRTGTMWNSMKVKLQSPRKAGAIFTGRAAHGRVKGKRRKPGPKGGTITFRKVTNNWLARHVNKNERMSLFQYTPDEAQRALDAYAGVLTGEILTAIGMEEQAYDVQKQIRTAKRRVAKALKIRRIHGIPPSKAYGNRKARRRRARSPGALVRRLLKPRALTAPERKIYLNTF